MPYSRLAIRSETASHPPIFSATLRSARRASSSSLRNSSGRVPSASNAALTATTPCSSRPRFRRSSILASTEFTGFPLELYMAAEPEVRNGSSEGQRKDLLSLFSDLRLGKDNARRWLIFSQHKER